MFSVPSSQSASSSWHPRSGTPEPPGSCFLLQSNISSLFQNVTASSSTKTCPFYHNAACFTVIATWSLLQKDANFTPSPYQMHEFNVTPRLISQNDGNTLKYQGREASLQKKIPEKVLIKNPSPPNNNDTWQINEWLLLACFVEVICYNLSFKIANWKAFIMSDLRCL